MDGIEKKYLTLSLFAYKMKPWYGVLGATRKIYHNAANYLQVAQALTCG